MSGYIPTYQEIYESGKLQIIASQLLKLTKKCAICPHNCGIDRSKNKSGKCKSNLLPIISSFNSHFGEEAPLVGKKGSGTIFFTNCNLSCIFCQNYDISQQAHGEEISFEELARIMLVLQSRGCHNINLVTPTHMVYAIIKALEIAIPQGLKVPLVYNSGGYDSLETLKILNGVFDIFMPDFKYMNPEVSKSLSGADNYPEVAMRAIKEMHNQVGDLQIDHRGIAHKGLLVRHLVLPNNLSDPNRVLAFISNLSNNTYINIMDQYRPEYRSNECFDLKRRVTLQEFDEVITMAKNTGLKRIDGHI